MGHPTKKFNEFLNPKSMLTPGLCGAVIMTVTNALGTAFNVTGLPRTAISLGLSFLVGSLVFTADIKSTWQKLVLYFLNSLVIFSMASGTNSAGQTAAATSAGPAAATTIPASLLNTQVVEHVVTNVHTVPRLGPIHLVTTNYLTNVVLRPTAVQGKMRAQFFEKWH